MRHNPSAAVARCLAKPSLLGTEASWLPTFAAFVRCEARRCQAAL